MEPKPKHTARAWWLTLLFVLIMIWGLGHSSYVLTGTTNYILKGVVDDGSSLSVAKVEGSVFSQLRVTGLDLSSASDSTQILADTIAVRYSLWKVLRPEVTEIDISNVRATFRRRPTGEYVLPSFRSSDSESSPFKVGSATIGSIRASILEDDSTLVEVRNGAVQTGPITTGSDLSFHIDTLWAEVFYPETVTEGRLGVRFLLDTDHKTDFSLRLNTEKSQLSMAGKASFDSLSVDGLSTWLVDGSGQINTADIQPFVPGLTRDELITLDATTTSTVDSTNWSARISTLRSGSVSAVGTSTMVSDSLVHVISADLRAIDPGKTYASLDVVSGINGNATARLVGNSVAGLNGWANVQLDSGRFDQISIRNSSVRLARNGNLTSGTATLRTGAGAAELKGKLIGEDEFEASGRLIGINGDLVADGLPDSDLNARFNVSGRIGPDGLQDAQGQLNFSPSRIASCQIESGRLSTGISRKRATLTSELALCADSPLTLSATVLDPFDNWKLTASALVSGLRVSELLEGDSGILVSAKADLAFTESGRLSGTAFIYNATAGDIRVDSLNTTFNGSTSRLNVDTELAVGRGLLRTNVLLTGSSRINVQSGSIEHIDLFELIGADSSSTTTYTSDLNGTFSGQVDLGGAKMAGMLDLVLVDSRVNRQSFGARVNADLTGDRVVSTLSLATSDSTVLDADIDYDIETGDLLASATLEGFDPLPFANIDGSSFLSGGLNIRAKLMDDMPFSANIEFEDGSRFNDIVMRSFATELNGDKNTQDGFSKLIMAGGLAEARYQLTPEGAEGTLRIQETDVAALLGIDSPSSLTMDLQLDAGRSDTGWNRVMARLDSLSGNFEHILLTSGRGVLELSDNGIRLDSLSILGTFGSIDLNGFVPTSPSHPPADATLALKLNSELGRLSQMQNLTIGLFGLEAQGRLEGSYGQVRLNSSFSMTDARASVLTVNRIQGRVLGELGDSLAVTGMEMTADLSLLEVTPAQAEKASVSVSYDGTEMLASVELHLSEGRDLGASVSWLPVELPDEITLLDFNATLDGDQWQLSGTPVFDLQDNMLRTPFILTAGDQRIVAVSSKTETSIRNLITVQQLKIDPFADILTYSDLGGVIGGTLTATTQDSTFLFQGTLNGGISAFNKAVGELNFQFNDDGTFTRLNAGLKDVNGESIQLSGSIPRMDSENQVQIQLAASSYSVDWIRSLIDPDLIDDLKGRINGEIRISGTPSEPNWDGLVRLQNGQIGLPELGKRKGMVVNGINANFRFDGEVITVDSLRARSGDGVLRGSGTIDIRELKLGEYNISMTATDFKAIDSNDYFAVVSGQMTLGGTTDRPKLGGRITVHRGDFWLSDATTSDVFEPLALSDEDLHVLQRRFGLRIAPDDTTSFDAYEVLALENFTVRMERDTWIRSKSNPKMDIQLTGDLDVRKKPKQDPEVFGQITVLPERSRIIQFGKRFDLERGELTFNGPMKEPNLNMAASYTVPSRTSDSEEVIIRLIASGSPDNLDVSFASDPSMELSDILSYIATGRPAAASLQISGGQSDAYLQSAAGLAIGPVADLIENLAGSGLGLDVIEIEHTGFSGLTLTAGKYVSPKLYVSVSQPISLSSSSDATSTASKNQTQVTLEYELVRQLLLSLLNRGTIIRINLRWQTSF